MTIVLGVDAWGMSKSIKETLLVTFDRECPQYGPWLGVPLTKPLEGIKKENYKV